MCPSCHLVHFFLRYASLHHVRSLTICYKAGHPICFTHSLSHGNAPAFTQAFPTILTGFHFASLRHPFTSVAFSTPAANNFARLAATGCVSGLRCHITIPYAAHATLRPFTVRPSFLTSFYWPPHPVALAGTSVRTSLQCLLRLADAAWLQLRLLPAAASALFSRRRYYLFPNHSFLFHKVLK